MSQLEKFHEAVFELPLGGATGFASIGLSVKQEPKVDAKEVWSLASGEGFTILREEGDWWYIDKNQSEGWVTHKYCFINMPDVIPSIVYKISNAYSSMAHSSGVKIPGITGHSLYQSISFNERLQREKFISPVLYLTAKKVSHAQKIALSKGDTLVLYEAFRPWSVQKKIVQALSLLADANSTVYQGLNQEPWGMEWFILGGTSLHQKGVAVDVSLARIDAKTKRRVGDFYVPEIVDYTEYTMPTPIHELSNRSAVFVAPITSPESEAWRNMDLAPTMNEFAISLQQYMTESGLSPLESEWWHFEDTHALEEIKGNSSQGDFVLTHIYSRSPRRRNGD